MYVEDYEGRRIVCTHPLELGIVETALDIRKGTLRLGGYEDQKWWWSRKRKEAQRKNKAMQEVAVARTGFWTNCLCLDCMEKQRIDLERGVGSNVVVARL